MSGALDNAFLADIVENIDDDTPRLVYADWLEDNGRNDRAEFIRVQVERARLPVWDAAQVRLRLREEALLKRHGEAWLAEMPAVKGARWEGFRRGIVAEVSFASYESMRVNAHTCRAVAPVEAVTVHWPRRGDSKKAKHPIAELRELTLIGRPFDEVRRLAASPQLATLRVLTVLGLNADDVSDLVASPHLSGLRALRLASNGLGTAGIDELIQAATLNNLEELDLTGPGYFEAYYQDPIINASGMAHLAAWPGLTKVRSLKLTGSDIRSAGLRALLNSPHAVALKDLHLRSARLDGPMIEEFRSARAELQLDTLDLGGNLFRQLGAEHIAEAPCLSALKELRIDQCEIPRPGACRLALQARFLDDLRLLDVGHNYFGPDGLGSLLERKPQSLHTLNLANNDLSDKGVKSLAESSASDVLLELDLTRNRLGTDGAQALIQSTHLRKLLVLRLRENNFNDAALEALSASSLGKRLPILELDYRVSPDIPF